ncbi:MAG: hypothetical protein WBO58_06985 [Gammaproteobacteria bacterium]
MKYLNLPVLALSAAFVATPTVGLAWDHDDEDEIPFEEGRLFFELNDTDGDLGIHGKIDGDEWKYLEIEDPRDRKMLHVIVRGRLKRQGLTELFFESAEPTFDELDPDKFFRRFPEGEYDIEGVTLDGEERESEVWLSHIIPAAPEATADGTSDPEGACTCDPEDLDERDTCPDVPVITAAMAADGVTIAWPAVTMSHAELGTPGVDITDDVRYYEVVVEIDETDQKATAVVPPTTTSWEVPPAFLAFGDEIKYEVLVRINNKDEVPGNKSAIESCFEIE